MFYRLKLKPEARGTSKEVFGVSVNKEVSTFVETVRDLQAEADKKNLKSVEIIKVDQLPERGEDGNVPHLVDFKDEGLSEQAQEQAKNESAPIDGSATGGSAKGDRGAGDAELGQPPVGNQSDDKVKPDDNPPAQPEVPSGDSTAKDGDEGSDAAATESNSDDVTKKQYRVLPGELGGGVEYPRGTVHEPGSILELTDDEVKNFAPGLIEPLEEGSDNE